MCCYSTYCSNICKSELKMKSLQLLICAAFLLIFINAKTEDTKYVSHVKCAELFGKCILKITEKLNEVNEPMVLKRAKRSIINGGAKCAQGQIWYWYRCWDCKKYTELTGLDC